MTTKARLCIAGLTLASVATFILTAGNSQASLLGEDLPAVVKKIAAEIGAGKADQAKKLAEAAAKNKKLIEEISDLMHMYRPSDKGGLNIEADLKKASAANAKDLGNRVQAMADLTIAKGWADPKGKRTKKAWNDFTEEMRTAGAGLAKAKNDAEAKAAATKVTNACTRCHTIFKD